MSFSAVPTESERPSGEVITSEAIGYEAIRGGNHEQSHHEAINFKNEVNIKNHRGYNPDKDAGRGTGAVDAGRGTGTVGPVHRRRGVGLTLRHFFALSIKC